jgi:DNA-binding MarR family transcriptional regulator
MPTSRDLPADRAAIGQLLVRLLRHFRTDLLRAAAASGYSDVREPHLQIFGNIYDGARLTELAARAQLSLAATSELVNDLQQLGFVERRPDPRDRRAKLIVPTPSGQRALAAAGDRVAEIEEHWASLIGRDRFTGVCRAMQDLLDTLDADHAAAHNARQANFPTAERS